MLHTCTHHISPASARLKMTQCVTRKTIIFSSLSDTVSAEITEKNALKEQEREREHCVWEEVMEIHDGKNKKRKERTRKITAESAVRLKSVCHHILLTYCNRCSLNATLSATDRRTAKQTNHSPSQPHSKVIQLLPVSIRKDKNGCLRG